VQVFKKWALCHFWILNHPPACVKQAEPVFISIQLYIILKGKKRKKKHQNIVYHKETKSLSAYFWH